MVPARNLLRRHFDNYGCHFGNTRDMFSLKSNRPMDDEVHHHGSGNGGEAAAAAAVGEDVRTSSREIDDWLRLGIGRSSGDAHLAELQLFSSDRRLSSSLSIPQLPPLQFSATTVGVIPTRMPLFPQHGLSYSPGVDVPRRYWNPNPMVVAAPRPPLPLQYSFLQYAPGERAVVSPPRRPQAGVWFLLRAAQNQAREPFLPQIPKSYLRIKDGRMTVRLLIKYLVGKLGLDGESEMLQASREVTKQWYW